MKKQILLLAGSALILASCGSNNTNQAANDQAKIDSISKANAAMQDAINKQKNDSTINAMAKAKADSIEMAKNTTANAEHKDHKGSGHKAPAPVATPTVAPPPPQTVGNGKPKMGAQPTDANNQPANTVGNGKPKMGGK